MMTINDVTMFVDQSMRRFGTTEIVFDIFLFDQKSLLKLLFPHSCR